MSIFSIFFFLFLPLLFKPSHSTTVLVDGSSEWKNPTVSIGDSISTGNTAIYTFSRTRKPSTPAISLRLLFSPTPTLPPTRGIHLALVSSTLPSTMAPSKHAKILKKLAIKVSSGAAGAPPEASTMVPEHSPMAAPAPSSGGDVPSSPSFPWPFRPHQAASPGAAPALAPVTVPLVPGKGGGMPFINSNPAVPLPTGEVDSATIRPLPISSHQGQVVMIGSFGFHIAVQTMVALLLL